MGVFLFFALGLVLIWLFTQGLLALGPELSWALALCCLAACGVYAVWLTTRAGGLRPRMRVRALRRHLGDAPDHILAVRLGDHTRSRRGPRAASAHGMSYLVNQATGLEVWRWSSRKPVREHTIDRETLTQVDVAPGGDSGFWTDTPALVRLWSEGEAKPFVFSVPGNQPGTIELPWRLDKEARRRRKARDV